jgi:hypothetical protein
MLEQLIKPAKTKLYEILAVALLVSLLLHSHVRKQAFHGDESHWIYSSASFEAFISLDFGSTHWKTDYWTLTQPPMVRYIVGMGRRLGGYGPGRLNLPYLFGDSHTKNLSEGRIPNEDLLYYGRLPMVLLGAICLSLLYSMLSATFSRLGATFCLILVTGNELIMDCLPRAMSETPLLLCTIVAWFFVAKMMRSIRRGPAIGSNVIAGVICGLTASVKLNGFSYVGIFIAANFAGMFRKGGIIRRSTLFGLRSLAVSLATWVLFVSLNPFLYTQPLNNLHAMYRNRIIEINRQTYGFKRWVYKSRSEGIVKITSNSVSTLATIKSPKINILSALLGLLLFVRLACIRCVRRSDLARGFLLTAVFSAGPWYFSPIVWARYQFIPVFFVTILIAIGLSSVLAWVAGRLTRGPSTGGSIITSLS